MTPSGTWTDNHINVEPAWDYTMGRRDIKIGVFDIRNVRWDHEDFGDETPSTTKVDGYDLFNDIPLYAAPLPGNGIFDEHANAVAGIIGAINNNDKGVAGISGGNYVNGTDLDSSGCAIYSMNSTLDTTAYIILDYITDGIVGSATENSGLYGYGLNIMNFSMGVDNTPIDSTWTTTYPIFIDTNITLMRDAIHFANREQVTVVASRGNAGEAMDDYPGWYHEAYPANFDDDWVICVGGTGTDGNYLDKSNNYENVKGSRGWEIDVAGPASWSHVFTLSHYNTYGAFDATSAAAPHVSGTAGLLMSYLNDVGTSYNNLAPEDVEHIIEYTATDKDTTILPGKDSLTGYGLINAGAALNYVDKDYRKLYHFGFTSVPSSFVAAQVSSNDTVTLSERYENISNQLFLWNTPYIVNTWQVDFTCNHNIPAGESIVESWPRPSGSNTFGPMTSNNLIYPRERVEIVSINNSSALVRGYIYEVYDTLGNQIGWWPMDFLNQFEAEYTVITEGSLNIEEKEKDQSFSVYPNPSSSEQYISIKLIQPTEASLRLFSSDGKLVMEIFNGKLNAGISNFNVDISKLSSGVYIYSLLLDSEVKEYKITKE